MLMGFYAMLAFNANAVELGTPPRDGRATVAGMTDDKPR
jgi:hypothetical protein